MGVPVAHVLVPLFSDDEVQVQLVIFGDGGPKVQVDFGVEALLEALLLLGHVEVEVPVEVRHVFVGQVARGHAVPEHHSFRAVEVHQLVVLVRSFAPNSSNFHRLLRIA